MIRRFFRQFKTRLMAIFLRPSSVDADRNATSGNIALNTLRVGHMRGVLSDDITLTPGVELHADPALEMTGTYRSPAGQMLEIDAKMQRSGGWVGLHIALPHRDLSDYEAFGFVARFSASQVLVAQACLRSGVEGGGFKDHFFEKHLLLRSETTNHLDALHVHCIDDFDLDAPWRELILFLPTEDFHISLVDLRVFSA
jgi:hypothetical protein